MILTVFVIVLVFLLYFIKPVLGSAKRIRSSIADITHESMEILRNNMHRHTYRIIVRNHDFFNNNERGLEGSFEAVIREVIQEIQRDLNYDWNTMRVGINFIFNDKTPRDMRYHVNIRYRDVADGTAVIEIMRRLQNLFQSADKATFSNFKVVVTVFRLAQGNGCTNGASTTFAPQDMSFIHSYISKIHLDQGPTGCAFRAVVLFRKVVIQKIE